MMYFSSKGFQGGWFIGNFPKTVLTTPDFEVSYKEFKAGEQSDGHYHTKSIEYNLVVKGRVLVDDDIIVEPGRGFIYEKFECSNVKFLDDSALVVIRTPSVNDKEYPSEADGSNPRLLSLRDYGSNSELHPK